MHLDTPELPACDSPCSQERPFPFLRDAIFGSVLLHDQQQRAQEWQGLQWYDRVVCGVFLHLPLVSVACAVRPIASYSLTLLRL